jgi:hypothetical protein
MLYNGGIAMIKETKLQDIKKEILEGVKKAARQGNIESIVFLGKAAEQCDNLIIGHKNLEKRIKEFCISIFSTQGLRLNQHKETKERFEDNITTFRPSPKREGAIIRNVWVNNIKTIGVKLTGHGKRFQTESGIYVSVASANELNRPQLLNKWFLGLKDEQMDVVVVLLCRDLEKEVHDIVIPVSELGASWETLSRSRGQVKFNIRRQREEFKLLVPSNEPLDVTKYIGNYKPLLGQPVS